ncbi:MAG: hypothetical protein KDB22_12130 [Planctomycetales bacterium]|nr:hypothetical protein [Planctomycetales bacterium]
MVYQLRIAWAMLLAWCVLLPLSETAIAQQRLQRQNSQVSHARRPQGGQPSSVRTIQHVSGAMTDLEALPAPGGVLVTPDTASTPLQSTLWDPQFDSSEIQCDAFPDSCLSCGSLDGSCCPTLGCLLDWRRADLWAGTTSFTGPANYVTTAAASNGRVGGAFGFQEGFNLGSQLPSLLCGQLGSQLGMRFTHTLLDGSVAGVDHRTQTFATAGLFRRVDYGLQGGLVVDYLHDDWVYQADLVQLRGEMSFLFSPCHDFGFRFTDSQQIDDTTATVSGQAADVMLRLETLNTYRFFYRYRYGQGSRGQAELQAGWTKDSGTVLGLQLDTPLQNQIGLQSKATYIIPSDGLSMPYSQEGWNLSLAVVWTPGRIFGTARDYYRPLMDVADNGSFRVRVLR